MGSIVITGCVVLYRRRVSRKLVGRYRVSAA